ncbi:MAG TPA: hypothetical protein VGL27_01560 [Negativicutes bacterium]|jgi:hypothetical protein
MTWLYNNRKSLASMLVAVVLAIGGCFIWQHYHQPQIATSESQQQAETPAGVDLATNNAHIAMLQSQLKEAAQQIAELKNKPPDTVLKTVPVEVVKVVTQEVEKRGADFAIVTDPKTPDKVIDLKEVAKLPEATPITLNQYNVFAYKKVIRGINIYPEFSGITPSGVAEITADVSRRISNDGKYLGVIAGYEFDAKKGKVGLRYMF